MGGGRPSLDRSSPRAGLIVREALSVDKLRRRVTVRGVRDKQYKSSVRADKFIRRTT